jgi:adenylate kinase
MKAAMEHIRRGELVPDTIVWEMVRERSDCLRCRGGFILDGFPRTLTQAESLKEFMDKEGLPLNAVVDFEAPVQEILLRLGGRRTCQECKAVFHISVQPPRAEGACDHCGGVLYQREDDRPESITVRLETYERSTRPLVQFYEGLGLLRRVAAAGPPDAICARTMQALGTFA